MLCRWICLAAFLVAAPAWAKVSLIATTTDLAWAARAIGGEHVDVKPLLKGTENAHFVDAVPEFIRLVASADIVCSVGLSLEVGWLPKVLDKAGNAKVMRGGPGHCEAGRFIKPLEKPQGAVDRSMGDVHPEGNPHFWLSPRYLGDGARAVLEALKRVDAAHAKDFEKNYEALQKSLAALEESGRKRIAEVAKNQKLTVLQYHKDFDYFMDAYQLTNAGSIEEKPGVPPSAGRLARVAIAAKKTNVAFALAVDYDPKGTLDKFGELSQVPVVRVPNASRPGTAVSSYEDLQKHLIDAIVDALKRKGHG